MIGDVYQLSDPLCAEATATITKSEVKPVFLVPPSCYLVPRAGHSPYPLERNERSPLSVSRLHCFGSWHWDGFVTRDRVILFGGRKIRIELVCDSNVLLWYGFYQLRVSWPCRLKEGKAAQVHVYSLNHKHIYLTTNMSRLYSWILLVAKYTWRKSKTWPRSVGRDRMISFVL